MANTYTQIYVHVVFAPKSHQPLLDKGCQEELQRYTAGIIKNRKYKPLAVNVMPDHVHILISLHPNMAVSALMREVKAISSKFINERGWFPGKFHWQDGYGAFSCSQSQLSDVIRYIQNQEKHHAQRSFQEEYRALLERFDIQFDERYLFDYTALGRPDGA